jgi:hypothetical protein
MHALLEQVRPAVAFVLGDGRDDALAFDALRKARSGGTCDGLAIAVAAHADTVADVAPSADLVLESQREVARFLAGIGRGLAQPNPEAQGAPSTEPRSQTSRAGGTSIETE